ncbi:MAG: hypothetical protein KME56_17675 [Candidatus Thiodiazotropha sp. (ex Ctena orbiculata)]|uniref:Uncharacterized protein n=1 Tax=Candidatus Thiodiazotropha taylori TaxID=2792791 RepID=A0A944QVX4_9GAMM|nr:hypothetical protein [Candidatus Thiodiazotropha taylori]MBT2990454.1 hypothetical protein [Candidatus Thiodiazotropha taylori]MBT2998445.1 hypothetical protein [Candidatus Thiodiazotropha taylori]MBT3002655.1 hypothetical protein [Candidatus Thiodiazotropha taylori]MBT3028927.1 hypothetical protein [Candidatus Thiodiazotropha taylori]
MPRNKDEWMAWPPMGAGVGSILGMTLFDALAAFHETILTIEGETILIGYLFPVCMGIGIAIRLEGRDWLGFAWLGFLLYLCGLGVKLITIAGVMGYTYAVLISCAIMLAAQSAVLYVKQRLQRELTS